MKLEGDLTTLHPATAFLPTPSDVSIETRRPDEFWAAGRTELLNQSKIGFFCSSQCPGSIVLKTFDAVTQNARRRPGTHRRLSLCHGMGVLANPAPWTPADHLGSRADYRRNAFKTRTSARLQRRPAAHSLANPTHTEQNHVGARSTAQSLCWRSCKYDIRSPRSTGEPYP